MPGSNASPAGKSLSYRPALILLAIGAILRVAYYFLATFRVGGIGAPTDIGGGLIALFGYVFIAAGLILALTIAIVKRRQ